MVEGQSWKILKPCNLKYQNNEKTIQPDSVINRNFRHYVFEYFTEFAFGRYVKNYNSCHAWGNSEFFNIFSAQNVNKKAQKKSLIAGRLSIWLIIKRLLLLNQFFNLSLTSLRSTKIE